MTRPLVIILAASAAAAALVATAASGAVGSDAAWPSGNVQRLDSGLAASLQDAARNLGAGGDRLKATQALDGARRLARVRGSLIGCPRAAWRGPLKTVEAARHDLQIGRTHEAVALLQQADLSSSPSKGAMCSIRASAAGKRVVDSRGEYIGRLVSVSQDGQAVLKTGGAINWLGFIDFGARRTTVPADRLVEGERMVVLLGA